ncbi:S-layer homology domain-containing protein [Paenibacillus dokdonensis]|uniref:S-layer homology domain-containing protein n=1 Tax=Paenibacillus dokdonensis TaxID=2567944 RepID=UPI0010A86F6F|nr:S-layer homology domain-containing protein [Paenibacillus dokdonensis]
MHSFRRLFKREMTFAILVLIIVFSYFPTSPVKAATLGTVTFTTGGDISGDTVTAGQGGSSPIPGMTLQIISNDGFGWSYEQPYIKSGIAASYGDKASSSLITIKSSDSEINFDFQSFFVADYGGGPITVTGYDNSVPIGSVNLDTTVNGWENTFTQSNGLTASIFQNVDEVRITPQIPGNMWIALNDIQIGSPMIAIAPSITGQPSNATIAAGGNANFSVTASNATGYQWQVNTGAGFTNISNGAPYSGATTPTLTITGATAGMNGYMYRVVVNGAAAPNAVSNGATLTVNTPPSITGQPSNATIAAGGNANFSVTASNATGYQWQVNTGAGFTNISNGAPYSGATTPTLTITGATAGMNGYMYRVVVNGAAAPNAVSNGATLTVNTPPSITGQPSNSTIAAGGSTTFSVTASNATGYQWQVDQGAGFTNISNGAPYSGATTSTLTITGATADMNGYIYRVIASGAAVPNAVSNGATLTVNTPPSITGQPSNSTIAAGGSTTFSVTASNATGYQWQVDQGAGFTNISNGAPYSGATTSTLTITGATADMNGYIYRVIASGAAVPNAVSNGAALTVNTPPSITGQPSNSTIAAGGDTTFSVTASNATGYQWQVDQGAGFTNISNGAPYSGATTSTLTITGATADMNGYIYRVIASGAAVPNAVSNGAALTVNTPPSITGQPSNSTIAAGGDTTFSVTASNATGYQWQVDQGAGFTNISNGAPYSGATTSTLTITEATAGMNGYMYRVIVGGAAVPNAVSNGATLTVNTPPSITGQPSNSTIAAGGDTTFSVTASNATGYQWQVDQGAGFTNISNGAPYSGATTSTLTITEATAGMNGYMYRVIVGGAAVPNAVSNGATLTVQTVPGAPTQVSAVAGDGEATIVFRAPADNGGSVITSYEVKASPGGLVQTGTTNPITIKGLSNGTSYTFTVKAVNDIGVGEPSVVSNAVTPREASTSDPGGSTVPGTSSPAPSIPTPNDPGSTNKGFEVLINGKAEKIGTATTSTVNGQTVTTVVLDPKKLEARLAAEGNNARVQVHVNSNSDVVITELNGSMLQIMKGKRTILDIQTNKAAYGLLAEQLDLDSIATQIGKSSVLQDMKIQIKLATPTADLMRKVQDAAAKESLILVSSPMSFKIQAVYAGTVHEISRFATYVKHSIAIPDSAAVQGKILTGVIIDPDGSVRHVPTKVIANEGNSYAVMNSLTSGTYAVVWHPVVFRDTVNHWAQNAIDHMGARMVIDGTGEGNFDPDRNITRAEFAAILTRGLGLHPEHASSAFTDVKEGDWYNRAVQTAYAYHLINGYEDRTFHPTDNITREQAMVMLAKAMETSGLKPQMTTNSTEEVLRSYTDAVDASPWAQISIAISIQAGLISGRTDTMLAPKAPVTRAEVATMIERLLQKSGLI